MTPENRLKIEALAEAIRGADRLLLGAGAGLSASAGLSYFDEEGFRRNGHDRGRSQHDGDQHRGKHAQGFFHDDTPL